MQRILITGGSGTLGTQLAPRLLEAGFTVRIMSRKARKEGFPQQIEWSRGRFPSVVDIEKALAGVDTVVHAASTPVSATTVDTEGAQRLLALGQQVNISHFFYISIAGIDRHPMGYYQEKLATEAAVESGGVPWTMLRATQFHELLDKTFLPSMFRLPLIGLVPKDFQFQLIDSGEVADRMVELIQAGPAGRAEDIGGPEVRLLGDLAESWVRFKGINKRIVNVPLPGPSASAFRKGLNTVPDKKYGTINWEAYLSRVYGQGRSDG